MVVKDVGVDVSHAVIACPFPGTKLYEQYDREGRLLTYDWSKYDCRHAVFQPKNMTPRELEAGVKWYERKFYSLKGTMKYYSTMYKLGTTMRD